MPIKSECWILFTLPRLTPIDDLTRYYSTHQYFLSRRSLYVVVWRVPDGVAGLAGIQHWLVSIQARAPNSPVIIVGTHYDTVAEVSTTIFIITKKPSYRMQLIFMLKNFGFFFEQNFYKY